jgi:hypothetical protein
MILDIYHIYPLNDLKEHLIDGPEAALGKCECKPVLKEGGLLIVHNSFDGREILEQWEAEKERQIQ